MLRSIALSALLWAAFGGGVLAETSATESVEACIDSAVALEQLVDDKALSPAEVEQIDDMLTEMENYCDHQQFAEAMALAGDISGLLALHQ